MSYGLIISVLKRPSFFYFVLFSTTLLGMYSSGRALPFYFNWDTDASVVIDVILINSGLLPEHINHPSYGAYNLLALVLNISSFIAPNGLLASSLADFQLNCLDPLKCLENTTTLLHFVTRLLLFSSVFLLAASMFFVFQSRIISISVLVIFLLDEGFSYSQHVLKSETFSLSFFLISLSCFFLFLKSSKRIYFIFASLLAGLVFFTKVQFLFYAIFLFLVAVCLPKVKFSKNLLKSFTVLLGGSMLCLGYLAQLEFADFNIFTQNISMYSPLFLLMLSGFICGFLLLQQKYLVSQRFSKEIVNLVATYLLGYSSIFLALFISGPSFGLMLVAQTFAASIMRLNLSTMLSDKTYEILYEPTRFLMLFILVLILCVSAVFAARDKKLEFSSNKVRLLLLFLIVIIPCLNLFAVFRDIYRDLMPAKTLLLCSALIGLAYLTNRFMSVSFVKKTPLFLTWIVLIFAQSSLYQDGMRNLVAENAHYGASSYKFHTGAYGGNHDIYKSVLDDAKIDTRRSPAIWLARANKHDFKTLLPNIATKCLDERHIPAEEHHQALQSINIYWAATMSNAFFDVMPECLLPITHSAGWFILKEIGYPLPHYRKKIAEPIEDHIELMPRLDLQTILVSPTAIDINSEQYYENLDGLKTDFLKSIEFKTEVGSNEWHVYTINAYIRIPYQEGIYIGYYPKS